MLEADNGLSKGRSDLPLNFHPVAIRVSAEFTPTGAVGATGRSAEPSAGEARWPVAVEEIFSGRSEALALMYLLRNPIFGE